MFVNALAESNNPALSYAYAFGAHNYTPRQLEALAESLCQRQSIMIALKEARKTSISIDQDDVTENLVWALHTARQAGDAKEVKNITMALAQIHGLVVERSENLNANIAVPMSDVIINGETISFDVGKEPTPLTLTNSNAPSPERLQAKQFFDLADAEEDELV